MTTNLALSADQRGALQWLNAGENVFLTGAAGTGKTTLLSKWISDRRHLVAVTASTGIAATHLGGQTIHSWAGIGTGEKPLDAIVSAGWWLRKCRPRIQATTALVIDEISMLDGETLDLIDMVCCSARGTFEEPFGGIQVILVGDLAQLPPVSFEKRGFAFDAQAWKNSFLWSVRLTQVHRQEDKAFSAALEEMRQGEMSDDTFEMLAARVHAFDPVAEGAVRLMTHNHQVDDINESHLQRLPGREREYVAQDFAPEPAEMARLDKSCLSPKVLRLKPGSRVMATKNDSDGRWANGSLGTVVRCLECSVIVDFDADRGYSSLEVGPATWTVEEGGTSKILASREQIPLRLAWAITAHKSQGTTLDKVSVDLSKVFADGQAYVALSRARSLEGLNIEAWRGKHSIRAHPRVVEEIQRQG